ncbi:MAG: ABC transporter ATP-binding protein [Paludibacteraceae bacterium]|nr:ABC transporter ATP-binding protein [Paludibacteraceae bacterium]
MADAPYILSAKILEIGYNGKSITYPLNLSLQRGTLTALIGTNGCGKSTLIRTLSGLQKPLKGKVVVKNDNLASLSGNRRARLISHVLTDSQYLRSIKVRDLVGMGRFPYTNFMGTLTPKDREVVEQSMLQVNVAHKADQPLYMLSDGERQRTMIAKALAQDTPIIFLDEPTSFLDMRNKIDILCLLHKLASERDKTILLSTHDIDIALQVADSIWLMESGKRIITGSPEELVTSGKIAESFHSDAFFFNPDTRSFKVCR